MDHENVKSKIEEIKDRLRQNGELYRRNEAAVRAQVVQPVLKTLGWDTENPSEVIPEPSTGEGTPDYKLKWGSGSLRS